MGVSKRGHTKTHVVGSLKGTALSKAEIDASTLQPQSALSTEQDGELSELENTEQTRGIPGPDRNSEKSQAQQVTHAGNAKAQGFDTELVALKNEHMGKDARLYAARDNTGRSQYDGIIIAETGSHIIQKLNDRTAIVHEKTNLQQDVEVGDAVSIVYDKGKVYVEELSSDHMRQHDRRHQEMTGERVERENGQDEKRSSFLFARNIVRQQLGSEAKIFEASRVDPEKGLFTGTIIAITDHHVMQRIGANSVIAHDKGDISGHFGKGLFVQIHYEGGRGLISQMQKQFTRDMDRGLAR